MDKGHLHFVKNNELFWEKTENTCIQNEAMAVISRYTDKFLKRVHKLDHTTTEKHHLQHNNNRSPILDKDKESETREKDNEIFVEERKERELNDSLKNILEIGSSTVSLERLIKIFDTDVVSSAGMDFSRQTFFGLVPSSGHLTYAFADYIASLTHVLTAGPFINQGACDIEESVINWVKGIVGYPDTSNGVTVSGSSMGAVTAFSAARDHLLQSSDLYTRAVVYVADHTHLSSIRALRAVGLGGCVYRYIPSVKHRIISDALNDMINKDKANGLIPFLAIASMGATCMGALDPFDEIQEITEKHNVWLHVDAAYGGFFLLDDNIKARCKGINKADSITLDFHKGLSAPFGTAAVLLRDGPILSSAMSRGSAPYIQAPEHVSEYSPMDLSFEYTRPFRAFPVWMMLKTVGTEAVKSQLTEKISLTKYAYDILSQMENVSVYMEPDLSILAFRCSQGNEMTRNWLELINKEGTICTTPTVAESNVYIRFCILSFRTHLKAVDAALSSIKRTLDNLLRNENNRTIL